MRMRFCANVVALIFLSVAAQAQQPAVERARLTVRTANGRRWRVRVTLDATVAKGSRPTSVKVVAALSGAVVVVDTYRSREAGMQLCQAGDESFLRVIRTANGRATETFHEKLSSCRDNIELGSPGVQWVPQANTLKIDWLSAPSHVGQAGRQVLKVGNDAAVESVAPGQ